MTDHILLIEDSLPDAAIVQKFLASVIGCPRVTHVDSMCAAHDVLKRERFDVVVTDLTLPDASDLRAVIELREALPSTPIIVLTGLDSDETALQALTVGAQDYLVKGSLSSEALGRLLRYACHRFSLQRENQSLLAQRSRQHKKLRRQNRRLKNLVQTAQKFVDNVSHEFRTPLTVIQDYSSLLLEGLMGELTEEQQHFINVIADRTEDLNNMVDDMLDSSRLKAGILGLDRGERDVATIIDRVCAGLERKALVRDVALEVDIEDDLPFVYCDAEKAGRVITNLAVNAFKFCVDPGRVRIEARNQPETKEVVISVTDNGPGLDDSDKQVIFERFRQLENEVNTSTKGFGIGLSIVRELVDLNLGRLSVESEKGCGSTFWFTLPWHDVVEIARRHVDRLLRTKSSRTELCVVNAQVPVTTSAELSDELDAFWKYARRKDDLVLRVSEREWVLLLTGGKKTAMYFTRHIAKVRREVNQSHGSNVLPQPKLRFCGIWDVKQDDGRLIECVQQIQQEYFMRDVPDPDCDPNMETEMGFVLPKPTEEQTSSVDDSAVSVFC